jgi:MGT family glycosyltransferase
MQGTNMGRTKRILFMPECEDVGHAGRMLLIAQALREVWPGTIEFAGNGQYARLFPEAGFAFHEIEGSHFSLNKLDWVDQHQWSWGELHAFIRNFEDSLRAVIEGEVKLYRELQPDLIVWDGRFTVTLSAETARIPFVTLMHAYATLYTQLDIGVPHTLPLFARHPGLLFLTRLPRPVQQLISSGAIKSGLFVFFRIVNRLRRGCGLEPVKDVPDIFSRHAMVLMPDLEALAPPTRMPSHFHYIGPLAWQPEMETPDSVRDLDGIIYVTMGFTGDPRAFRIVIEVLAGWTQIPVVISTGNLIEPSALEPLPANMQAHRFLPGVEMAKRARLFICHGAPGTTAQALSQGVPIISIPHYLPQEFVADGVVALGAGITLNPGELTQEKVRVAVRECLENESYREAAMRISQQFRLEDGPRRAAALILDQLKMGQARFAQVAG